MYCDQTCPYFSIGWLRLLHHCLTQCESTSAEVAAASGPTPNLLVTCTALLVSHSAVLYATNIESVLLKIGLHSTDMSLALLDHILRNTNVGTADRGVYYSALHDVKVKKNFLFGCVIPVNSFVFEGWG